MENYNCPQAGKQGMELSKSISAKSVRVGVLAGNHVYVDNIIKNLMTSGYKIIIWSPLQQLHKKLKIYSNKNRGFCKFYPTPTLIVSKSDIIISCLDDSDQVESMITKLRLRHEHDDLLAGKCYVEMTNINFQASSAWHELMHKKSATYFEAMVQGTQTDAKSGKLVIVLAGDHSRFAEFQGVLESVGEVVFLEKIGLPSKIHLILQVMKGTFLAGLAEGFAFIEKTNTVELSTIQAIFRITDLSSAFLTNATKSILKLQFDEIKEISLEEVHENCLELLKMSNAMNIPIPLTACLSQVFKQAFRLELGLKYQDLTSVYMCMKY